MIVKIMFCVRVSSLSTGLYVLLQVAEEVMKDGGSLPLSPPCRAMADTAGHLSSCAGCRVEGVEGGGLSDIASAVEISLRSLPAER